MRVIVVGCGRLGIDLAYRLFKTGNEVTVVDAVPAAFSLLPADFTGRQSEGDALNKEVLHRAGIDKVDALAAVTNSDAVNAVVGHIARTIYNVPRVVVRNYDPAVRPLFETFGLQVISSTSWGAQRIEELIYHEDTHAVFSAGNGEVEIYEFYISDAFDGRPLSSVLVSNEVVAVALTRAGKSMLPAGDAVLRADDILHISATYAGMAAIRDLLCGNKKEK